MLGSSFKRNIFRHKLRRNNVPDRPCQLIASWRDMAYITSICAFQLSDLLTKMDRDDIHIDPFNDVSVELFQPLDNSRISSAPGSHPSAHFCMADPYVVR